MKGERVGREGWDLGGRKGRVRNTEKGGKGEEEKAAEETEIGRRSQSE